jgi:hypothetical protein
VLATSRRHRNDPRIDPTYELGCAATFSFVIRQVASRLRLTSTKALGFIVPPTLLARVDEAIE